MKKEQKRPQRTRQPQNPLARHRAFLHQAALMAEAPPDKGGSPHPKVKIGAILVDAKGKQITCGVNRFPSNVDRRRPERYENGSRSLWINCAEQMALAEALRKGVSIKGARLYVTLEPCAICAGLIAESGIKEVYVPVRSRRRYAALKTKWKHSIDVGQIKLAEAGVRLTAIDVDDLGTGEGIDPSSKA